MNTETILWPRKTRELQTPTLDSTQWNGFAFRDDDVVVNTYAKTGTTWTQAILVQLLHGAPEAPRVNTICRWLDCGFDQEGRLEALEAQSHRRIIKSHLPLDALVFSPRAKYVHVSRDGRDVAWSGHNHMLSMSDGFYEMMNASPHAGAKPVVRPSEDPRDFFLEFLEAGIASEGDFFGFTRAWWEVRDLPNVLLLHFQNLKDDLEGQVNRLADFLEIEIDPVMREKVLKHVSFDHMKKHADTMFPGMPMKEGARSFINKGSNGRWRDLLSPEDVAAYEAMARERLGEDCAHWVATGEMP